MRPTRVRYMVLFWMCLFALLAYVHRSAVAVPVQQIKEDLGIDDAKMAWVFSVFFWGYTIFQIPGGWLADRWGSRVSLFVLVSVWSVAMMGMGLLEGLTALLVCRGVMGVAQAGLFPAAVNSFGKWFPAKERGLPNGLLGSFMMIGAIIGQGPVGFLLDEGLTWQQVFWLSGVPGLVCAVWFYCVFRDSPQDHPRVNAAELAWIEDGKVQAAPVSHSESKAAVPSEWTTALVVVLLLLCGQHFFRGAATLFFSGSWFPTFLKETRDISLTARGLMTTLPLLGFTVGCAVGGNAMDFVYRRTGSLRLSRSGMSAVTMFLCAVLQSVPYWMESPLPAVLVLTLSCFIGGMGGPAAYVMAIDVGGKNIATVFSIMNMMGNIGAALAPDVVVWWKDRLGWDAVLFLQSGFFLGASLCWLGLCMVGRADRPAVGLSSASGGTK